MCGATVQSMNHVRSMSDLTIDSDGKDKVEKVCELVGISINKNSVPGDKSALSPGGIRIGTPSLTTRGFKEDEKI